MSENVEQIQACREALAPDDVLIGDANGGKKKINFKLFSVNVYLVYR